MRRYLVPALAVLGLVTPTVLVTAAPASAAYTTTVSAVDVSVPGHVSGTVTTDAPYVRLDLLHGDGRLVELGTPQAAGGTVPFDLETWGLLAGQVRAMPCADASTCDGPRVLSSTFNPGTVNPQVTFPADTTIGNEDYVIEVDDHPAAGGVLKVYNTWWSADLDREGATAVRLPAGDNEFGIARCHPGDPEFCQFTGIKKSVSVSTRFDMMSVKVAPTAVSTALGTKSTLSWWAAIENVTVDWELVAEPAGTVVPGFSGSGAATPGYGNQSLQVDLTGLGNGTYSLRGTASAMRESYGVQYSDFESPTFTVDNDAPELESVSSDGTVVYPVEDRYLDNVKIDLHGMPGTADSSMRVLILDQDENVLRTLTPTSTLDSNSRRFTFNGRAGGVPLPAGDYLVRGQISDAAGNTTTMTGPVISVFHEKLVWQTYKKTVTPAKSYVKQFVGACSKVQRPSARGWAGSFGLYSNTKCKRGDNPSMVETHHSVQVPEGVRYEQAHVTLYGGAAKKKPGSIAVIAYLKPDGNWGYDRKAGARLGNHSGYYTAVTNVLHEGGWLYWTVFTGLGMHYDVKSFTVFVEYAVLQ